MKKIFVLAFCLLCSVFIITAQRYHGITGLLQAPSAETDSAGTFYGGIFWMDKTMLPDLTYYGDGIPFSAPCYTIGITIWKWMQLSYTGTLVKLHPDKDLSRPLGYYNEDRHFNLKLRPLKEGSWWPAVALGWEDVGGLNTFKINKSLTTNNLFENIYIAASKHFDIKEYELGVHLAYRYYPSEKNKDRRGMAGGVTLRPAFYHPLRLIVEWDGIGVNAGVDVLLWKRLFVQACLAHGKGFSGGLGYHYTIPF